jgi:hypothetical protein
MRTSAGKLVLALVLGLAGCDSQSPITTSPTSISLPAAVSPVPSPPPVVGTQEQWNLTGTYLGHTGPGDCMPPFDGNARPVDSVLLIERAGESVQFRTEHNHYRGTLVANEFSATDNDDAGGTWQCGGRQLRFRTEGSVSGRFSADGRALTGVEVALFRLESGETIRREWSWSATR